MNALTAGATVLSETDYDFEAFFRSYLETALWSTNDDSSDNGGDPLDKNYSTADIDPETAAKHRAECIEFCEMNYDDLSPFDAATAGHDFWLTRNGHGCGFWDGDYPEPQASRLTEASNRFGEVWLYVYEGKIYSTY